MASGMPIPQGISGVPGHVEFRALKAFAAGETGSACAAARQPPLVHDGGFANDGQCQQQTRRLEDDDYGSGTEGDRHGDGVGEAMVKGQTARAPAAAVAEEEEEDEVEEEREEVSQLSVRCRTIAESLWELIY